ncbi:MAG: glucose-6-phosphate dehydrogenase [Candidatus Harrisonbacteria bacterium]|nr:glucose-6-phosphate dehydrogenase [Candidatus Harrisonbacteria bacterium]
MNPQTPQTKNIPTVFVVFGATGDLIQKKIAPALFHLFQKGKLPKLFKVVGFSRSSHSHKEFQNFIFKNLTQHKDISVKTCTDFCNLFLYQNGNFDNKGDYQKLNTFLAALDKKWGVCTNKLFYLAVPPKFYETIFKNLAVSGLTRPCNQEEGWTRVLVEKPFGKDLKTAEKLDGLLGKWFKEIQIYRIDHYLAKEMVQNILAFRFSNNLFEKNWNRETVEKVEIRLWEKLGVENRGSFYDGLGALRDVGQNHLLQILALIAMEQPANFEPEAVRNNRAQILNTLINPSLEEIKKITFRAQYEDYKKIVGVDPSSNTETYFKVKTFLSSPRWQGVPFILESGKRLNEIKKEVIITFKHPLPCLCPPGIQKHYTNKITIGIEPREKIDIQFWSKKPGLEFAIEPRILEFSLRGQEKKTQYVEEYEKLLLDAIAGDQTLFVTTEEVKAMWQYINPILIGWQKSLVPLRFYSPDTDQPIQESRFIDESLPAIGKFKKEIGIIGLGKMGGNIARRLMEKGWQAYGYNQTSEATKNLASDGLRGTYSLRDLVKQLSRPRLLWLMVPAGKPVDEVLFGKDGLMNWLEKDDVIIDGGNSFYKDSIVRFKKLKRKGIHFIDVGVSGGPEGARHGASLMIGGKKELFQKLEPLFYDIAKNQSYQFFEGAGVGHFVKMVHNGIEYGMMQAIAEGFAILKKAKYKLNLNRVADVYNHGSVIESRLIGWLKNAFDLYGNDLKKMSGAVGRTGEGAWTVTTAKEMKIKVKVIEEALKFRIASEKNPAYTGKILTALRNQFGGHNI